MTMKWRVEFSKRAAQFIDEKSLSEEKVLNYAVAAIRKFGGEPMNIDVKKLKGNWKGFHRIRVGKIRVIVEFNFESKVALIERVDFRGGVYK